MSVRNDKFSLPENRITDESIFWNRRQFIKTAGLAGGAVATGLVHLPSPQAETAPLTDEDVVTGHNNFYEFALSKEGPAELSGHFNPGADWTLRLDGEVEKPLTLSMDDIWRQFPAEERVYKLRCVEAWSMIVPWLGFPLAALLKKVKPLSSARFVEFTTLYDPKQFPGQRRGSLGFHVLKWPYREGLRMDEAMHPLTFLTTGVYGKKLPAQNGAPIRLVVPWKYGFKSIKSIVRIRFTRSQPLNSWQQQAPREYGFYANVNPNVDHPRWSQAKERLLLNKSIFGVKRINTELFNGYAEQVAHLYRGMDLRKYF